MVSYRPKIAADTEKTGWEHYVSESNRLVKSFMLSNYPPITPNMEIDKAAKYITDSKFSGLPVNDDKGSFLGFLSEKDCLKCVLAERYYNDVTGDVGSYMSTKIISLKPEEDLFHALELFISHPYHIYPVINDEGRCVGLVDRKHVLEMVNEIRATYYLKQNKRRAS